MRSEIDTGLSSAHALFLNAKAIPRMHLMQEVETFVFDLDGTLIERMSYEELLDQISRIINIPFQQLFDRYQSTWNGFEEAQRWHEQLAQPHQLTALKTAYDSFYASLTSPRVNNGARTLLVRIQHAGKQLICWTGGQESQQKSILRISELDSYFNHILVTPLKNSMIVTRQLLPIIGSKSFVMIGDSYARDIAPVIQYARSAFWITGSDANRFLSHPERIDPNVTPITHISELSRYL